MRILDKVSVTQRKWATRPLTLSPLYAVQNVVAKESGKTVYVIFAVSPAQILAAGSNPARVQIPYNATYVETVDIASV